MSAERSEPKPSTNSEPETTLARSDIDDSQALESPDYGPGAPPAEGPALEQLGRFRLDRQLGQGGMGQVWEAWDPQLERQVAIKRLLMKDLPARERFLREARLQATVLHPGVCPVFEVGQHQGEPYLVMPCLDGATLDQAVDGASLEYKLDLLRQVADAVHAAHQQGLIHRDLKPVNILVESRADAPARPVVLDFGIARPMEGEGLTASGEIVGTPAFMAPEQVAGKSAQLDRRTDVYALGATLYRLLTDRPPHLGKGTPLLFKIAQEEPDRLPPGEVPAEVEAIVFKCLEKDKNARYDSARALAEDLGRYLAGEPVEARPITRWIRLGKWVRRHRVAVRATSAASLVALAALAWGGWSAWRSEERQEVARRFGAQVEEIEALARYSHLAPLHDVRSDQAQMRARLDAVRPSLDDRDPVVQALAAHAMGRGHLALDGLETARGFLEMAYELDSDNSEIAADLGRTLSELYRDRLTDLERFGDPTRRDELGKQLAGRLAGTFEKSGELQRQSRLSLGEPALDLLRSGRTAVSSVELNALILFHEGQPQEALDVLAAAPPVPSWIYERWRLEGDIRRSWAVSIFHAGTSADVSEARHQLKAAREAYRRALSVAPSNAALLLDDAQTISLLICLDIVSLEKGGPLIQEARERLSSARTINPDRLDVWLWSLRLELTAAQRASKLAQDPTPLLEDAFELGQLARRIGHHSSGLWHEIGRVHEKLARQMHIKGEDPTAQYEQAAKAFDRVVLADRGYAFYTSLGLLHMTIAGNRAEKGLEADGAFESSIEAYLSAAELHSQPFVPLFNLGVALFNSASLDKSTQRSVLARAVDIFVQAQRLRPDSMAVHLLLGQSRQRLAQEISQDSSLLDHKIMEAATADLEKAVGLAPDRFEPWIGLAAALRLRAFDAFYRGNPIEELLSDARKSHQEALALAPEQPVALLNAGQVEYLAGQLALRQGRDPTLAASNSEDLCQRSLAARYRANALQCLGDAFNLHAEYRLNMGDAEAARLFAKAAARLFEKALSYDEDHIETLQSFPYLLLLESRRLRDAGDDPKLILAEAEKLLVQAFAVDGNELATRLVEVRWYLEKAISLQATGVEAERVVEAGHKSVAKILAQVPRSPEARDLARRLEELKEGKATKFL